MTEQETYQKLVALPPLQKDYLRAVHCYIDDTGICKTTRTRSLTKNGLVFNKKASGLSFWECGGSYNEPSSMVNIFDEEGFWEHLKKDNFSCYNDARHADTQIVFDIPIKEYAFLCCYGRIFHGKIDPKYIVGVIPNINGANKDLTLPRAEVEKAQQISMNKKDYIPPRPNDLKQMIKDLCTKYNKSEDLKFVKTMLKHIMFNMDEITDNLREDKQLRQKEKLLNTAQIQKNMDAYQ